MPREFKVEFATGRIDFAACALTLEKECLASLDEVAIPVSEELRQTRQRSRGHDIRALWRQRFDASGLYRCG